MQSSRRAQRKSVHFSEAVVELGCADDYDRTPVPAAIVQPAPVLYAHAAHVSGGAVMMQQHAQRQQQQQQEYVHGTWADMFLSMDTFAFC
jgi:hypothetical protein